VHPGMHFAGIHDYFAFSTLMGQADNINYFNRHGFSPVQGSMSPRRAKRDASRY